MKPRTKFLILLIFGFTLIILASCTPVPNCSATYNVTKTADTNDGVCSPGDCSLREAVLNANACPGSHTINLPAGGYTLTIDGDDEDLGETGDLDITDDLTIIGVLPPPSINGGIERSFHIHSGATVVFDHIWLIDGSAIFGGGLINEGDTTLTSFTCNYNSVAIPPEAMGDAMGGCIFNTGNLTILGGQFLANTAGFGGAIYNYDSAVLTIEDADFTGNEADGHGGAIWNGLNASLTINGGLYRLNEAGVNGGAIWNHGTVSAENLVIEENEAAGSGGGFFNWSPGAGYFTNSWFTLNEADLGGGLYNNEGMVHLYESGLTANTATTGGGVYNQGPAPPAGLLLKNVTVSNNTASGGLGGGGIYNNSNFDFRFITVADNSPDGIRIDGGAEIKLRSSVLSNNTGGDCSGISPDSLDYNIVSDSSCTLIGGHDLLDVDPLLEPLGFHGSTAPSHALGVGSPAIDSGVPDLCTAIDQNGTTRPQGAWCDRGAYENVYELGIVRGWTYIDANRNDHRDPTDGSMTGVFIDLKEGPCPGGAVVDTAESATGGFYEIMDIEPGDYCLARSMIQQTLYPDYHDLTFGPGDVLEDVNFRYLLSPLGDSSISGKVWHDECAVPYGIPPTPPPGCISLPGGGLGADGVYDPSEPGIEGIKIGLFGMGCPPPPGPPAAIVYTDANGDYIIPALGVKTWCVVVDALLPPNDTILIPGNWTYPDRNINPAGFEVVLGPSEDATDANFGWDYQFLPAPPIPYSYICPIKMDAFGREIPDIRSLELFVSLKGELFEVLAKSEQTEPVWYFGKNENGVEAWMSELVLDCEGIEPAKLFIRHYTPLADPTPILCRSEMDQPSCEASGGTWTLSPSSVSAQVWYCECP